MGRIIKQGSDQRYCMLDQTEQVMMSSEEELELRRKPWNELTDQQKIERQRDIVKDLQRTIGFMQDRLSRVESNFNQHSHTEKGIVVPLMNNGLLGAVGAGLSKLANPNYF